MKSSHGSRPAPRRTPLRHLGVALATPLLLLATVACSSDSDEMSPDEALASAKEQLDETSGVELSLSTDSLPAGVDGVLEATGTGTRAPAFEGELTVRIQSVTVDVPVVAVDGVVYAELPFTSKFSEIDPSDYDAPDPAQLMDPEAGISSWLTAATGVETGEQTRDGEDVLTGYTGTLPGAAVADVIPSADVDADFPATFFLDDAQQLRRVEVTGPFYAGGADVAYTVSLDRYGAEKEIVRP